MQSTTLKSKLIVLNGMYHIILLQFHNKLCYPKQILSRVPTELHFVERKIFNEEVNTEKFWTFELGTQEGMNVPTWIIVGFQQRDRQDSPNLNSDIFVDLQ